MKLEDDRSTLMEDLIATERRWASAHLTLDMDTIDRILSDDYRQIQSDGTVIRKRELLESYRSGGRRWDFAQSDEYDIRFFGDTALLTGRWRGVGENRGMGFDYTARFLAVYVQKNGEWRLVCDISAPMRE